MIEEILGLVMALWLTTFISMHIIVAFDPDYLAWVYRPGEGRKPVPQWRIISRFLLNSIATYALWLRLLPHSHHHEVLFVMLVTAILAGLDASTLSARLEDNRQAIQKHLEKEKRKNQPAIVIDGVQFWQAIDDWFIFFITLGTVKQSHRQAPPVYRLQTPEVIDTFVFPDEHEQLQERKS